MRLDIEYCIFLTKPSGTREMKLMYWGNVYISSIEKDKKAQLSLDYQITIESSTNLYHQIIVFFTMESERLHPNYPVIESLM